MLNLHSPEKQYLKILRLYVKISFTHKTASVQLRNVMNTRVFITEKGGRCTYEQNIEVHSCSHCCNGKTISIIHFECVTVVLVTQHAMPMRRIILCLSGCTILFPNFLINGTIFGKTFLNINCVFRFPLQLLSETFLILRRNERDIIKNVY